MSVFCKQPFLSYLSSIQNFEDYFRPKIKFNNYSVIFRDICACITFLYLCITYMTLLFWGFSSIEDCCSIHPNAISRALWSVLSAQCSMCACYVSKLTVHTTTFVSKSDIKTPQFCSTLPSSICNYFALNSLLLNQPNGNEKHLQQIESSLIAVCTLPTSNCLSSEPTDLTLYHIHTIFTITHALSASQREGAFRRRPTHSLRPHKASTNVC